VQIQHMAIAHSHPILTLNSRDLADDNAALSTYLHEQLHWFAVQHPIEIANADAELRQRYPAVPSFEAGGARNLDSTYLHLIVCALEYQNLAEVIGGQDATRTIQSMTPYDWIYRTILADWAYFEDLLSRTGLIVP